MSKFYSLEGGKSGMIFGFIAFMLGSMNAVFLNNLFGAVFMAIGVWLLAARYTKLMIKRHLSEYHSGEKKEKVIQDQLAFISDTFLCHLLLPFPTSLDVHPG